MDLLVDDLSDGFTKTMLAAELEQRPSWASNLVNELRDEVLLSSGQFFPLTEQEFEALKESIKEYGIQQPLIVGDHTLIDGGHRLRAAKELGYREVPVLRIEGKTLEKERELGIALNVARRHLNQKQRRALIRFELMRDSSRSSRRIAVVCGVDPKTVEAARRELATEDYQPTEDEVKAEHDSMLNQIGVVEIPQPEKRVDARGVERQAYVETRGRQPQPKLLGSATCDHGIDHLIYRDPDGSYRLERDERRD